MEVTFGIQRARGERQGVFVTATGGPGTSGLAVAESYTSAFSRDITEAYDIVFFDQRGIGLSGPVQCPDATVTFYTSDADPQNSTPTTGVGAAARDYAAECIEESGVDPAALPFYSTDQAVEDLEAFRIWLGVEQINLYGESYGTQFVQTYAAAHPDRLEALFIDGPVDLELTGFDYWAEGARAFDRALVATLLACTADEACSADFEGGDALGAYDALAAELEAGDRPYTFYHANGTAEDRSFRAVDLENAAAGYLYDEFDRMLFLRALSAASYGDVYPLARLAYLAIGQDPETLDAVPDDTYSDALYYSVECLDYDYPGADPETRAQAFLDAGRAAGIDSTRLASVFYGDMPCAYWPVRPPSPERPAGLADTGYPVFVMGATLDPATPWANAERIYERLANAYLIVKPGGPHIIFGRGESCPDRIVTAFLVDGEPPAQRRTVCEGDVYDDYVPQAPTLSSTYAGPLDALSSADDQINNDPDYWYWDGVDPLAVGCRSGGSLRYEASDVGYSVTLDACELADGFPLIGTGEINDVSGSFVLDVRVPDGRLSYERNADGERSVSGRLDGEPVRVSD